MAFNSYIELVFRSYVAGDFAAAGRARVMAGEPRGDAGFMVYVATGDLFTTLSGPEAFDAN